MIPIYIHPSNKYLVPGVVDPSFDPVTKTRTIRWFWEGKRAVVNNCRHNASEAYGAARELRLAGYHHIPYAYRLSLALLDTEGAEFSRSERGALFQMIGDGRPWSDPSLTLWEGATL